MAAVSPISVQCPACELPIEIQLRLSKGAPSGGRNTVVINVHSDHTAAIADHIAAHHAA